MNSSLLIGTLAVIVGSLVALSSFIIAKKPELKSTFEKIQPYQGFLGVGLLGWGIWDLINNVGDFGAMIKFKAILGIAIIGYIAAAILLGFILGFGLIASWIPGEGGAEKKGLELQKKLLTFSLPIGVIGLVCSIIVLYYYFTLKP